MLLTSQGVLWASGLRRYHTRQKPNPIDIIACLRMALWSPYGVACVVVLELSGVEIGRVGHEN